MLEKSNRLRKRKEFGYIYKHGESRYSKFIKLYFISSYQKKVKVGISVNNKVGKAVKRNRIKRQLRAILREILPNLKQKMNYIFVAKEGICDLSFEEIKKEVFVCLEKAKCFEKIDN